MTQLILSFLGPLQITLAGEPVTTFRSDKERALLAFLALEADRPHRREALSGLLWPEQSNTLALNSLRRSLHRLRQTLCDQDATPPFLLITPKTIQFNPNSDYRLDVAEFIASLDASQQHSHRHLETCAACNRRLQQTAHLYRGELLQGFFLADCVAFDEWVLVKREWLHRQMSETLSSLTESYIRRGEYALAQRYALQQIALEPWRESAHRQLMRALAWRGERSMALAQYEACRRVLAEELGIEPETETKQLSERIASGTWRAIQPPTSNLQPLAAPFIGRERELTRLCERLLDPAHRLVTLVGEGGIGKTWLAVKAAKNVADDFTDGARFVGLAGLSGDGAEIPETIAAAIGFTFHGKSDPKTQLLAYLRGKECLLVLDNFEQVLGGAELVREILEASPKVVMLVTSREPLKFQAEWIIRLEGLPVPSSKQEVEAERYSSVQLFLERAERAAGEFTLTAENRAVVIEICRMTEGLPLGITLAAAQMYSVSPGEVAQAIRESIDALAASMGDLPPRQRSIRAVFEWSWSLLRPQEQSVLAQLSVFRGGCRVEAAEAVAGASPTNLALLVDKSLLRKSRFGRFEMHELLRQFAAEKLTARGAHSAKQTRHAEFYLAFVGQRGQALQGTEPQKHAAELRLEIDNIRAAWHWAATEAQIDQLAQGLKGLAAFYNAVGLFQEGEQAFGLAITSLQTLIEATGPDKNTVAVLSQLKSNQAGFIYGLSQFDQTVLVAQEAIALAQAAGEVESEAEAYRNWGLALWRQWQLDAAHVQLCRALELARTGRLRRIEILSLIGLGIIVHGQNNLSESLIYYKQALAVCREIGDRLNEAVILLDMGNLALSQGDYAEAWRGYEQALHLCRELGDRVTECIACNNLGFVAHNLGDLKTARLYYQHCLHLAQEFGDKYQEGIVLQNLSLLFHHLGENEMAQDYAEQAGRLATEIGIRGWQGLALYHLGNALLGLERFDEATEMYRQGLELMREAGWHNDAMQALAGLARVDFARGDHEQALSQVEHILAYLETGNLDDTDEPFRVYLTCYHVLQLHRDTRAPSLLQTAYELLKARAETIGDERLRRSFLESVPAHRELAREFNRQIIDTARLPPE